MRIQKTLAALCSLFVAQCLTLAAFAVEVTEPAGAAHGYPGLYDINGKKLADSEFRQWVENNRLHVVITHKFSAGEVYEEHAQFRQEPELIQEKWSWKESKHGRAFSLGAAGGHFYQMIVTHNFSPGNVGLVLPIDILMPIVGFVFLWLSYKHPQPGTANRNLI